MGFEFRVEFNKALNTQELEKLWDDFVIFIESKKMYWGGGHWHDYFVGFLDCSESDEKVSKLMSQVLDYWIQFPFFKKIKFKYKKSDQ